MQRWETSDEMQFLGRAVAVLQEGGLLTPELLGSPSPLDMRGLAFPTVSQCNLVDLPAALVTKITGRLEFNNATLRDIDLTNAKLSFSVWNNCVFERVCFDESVLNQVRFFGCRVVNCSFRSADMRDASFSVGRNGAETEIAATLFQTADLRGASCSNPVFRATSFENCKLDGFVFDGALCDDVSFTGRINELTFRGMPNDGERNRIRINLSNAAIMWMNVDYGIDLRQVILPSDGSCLIVKDRLRAIECLCSFLPKEGGRFGSLVANVLKGLFSDRAMSSLEPSQDMILISKAMIADFAETQAVEVVNSLFNIVLSIAKSKGFLVERNGDRSEWH